MWYLFWNKRLALWLTAWLILGIFVSNISSAQLSIQTVISNAKITIWEILFSDDGLDTPWNPYKIRVYADWSDSETLVVDGNLKVSSLQTPWGSTTYLVRTDSDGILSFVDISSLSLGWWTGSNWDTRWIDSALLSTWIYYNQHVWIWTDVDSNYILRLTNEFWALRVTQWDMKFDQLGSWVWLNGAWVMTVDSSWIVAMQKITASMLDPAFLASLWGLWQSGLWESINYISWSVWVKTATPLVDFHVNGDILANRVYIASWEMTFTANGINGYRFTSSGQDLIIWSANNNVSIWWTNPSAKLEVKGDVLIDSLWTDDSWLKFDDLNFNSTPGNTLTGVDCNILWVDANWKVILVDANVACTATWWVSTWSLPQSYEVSGVSDLSISSTTPTLVTDMSITPPPWKYIVSFNAIGYMQDASKTFSYQIYVWWIPVAHSYREYTQSNGSELQWNMIATQWIVTVDWETIEIRRAILTDSSAKIKQRSMNLIKVQ